MPTQYPPRGTSRPYLLARFRREGLGELADAVETGQLSATAAAVELGWVKRPEGAGERRPNAGKLRAGVLRGLRREGVLPGAASELGPAELQELQLGPSPNLGSYFRDRAALHAAWLQSRAELLQHCSPGRRPQAFYEFEWEGDRPPYDLERSELWKRGLLTEQERLALEREWRTEWDFCHKPDFVIARSWPDGLLKGAAARAEHLKWADVPAALRRRWRRRQKSAA
jgi:hypothetical protein